MKIICAPDKFKGSLTAAAAATAMADGIRAVLPEAEIDVCPVADGGEGTVEAMVGEIVDAKVGARTGDRRTTRVIGPCQEPVEAEWAFADARTAVIETAAAAGLGLVPAACRDPRRTTTFGVGELLVAACRAGAQRVIIGLGGSGTVDGGCGMAQALGVRFRGSGGDLLPAPLTGGDLGAIGGIALEGLDPALAGVEVVGAWDVASPLLGQSGAARVFGPQKGAGPDAVEELEAGLSRLARIIRRDTGIDVTTVPGGGAAGGLGAGLIAFAGARLQSGIGLVLEALDFDRRVQDADLCLTGEGRLDGQSLEGKACLGVARAAAAHGVPTVALVGAVAGDAGAALSAELTEWRLIGAELEPAESMRRAGELLAAAAADVVAERCRQGWSPRSA